jgi:crossover junction endodeoxyribonuclease RuvC
MIVIGIDPGTPLTVAVLSADGAAILDMFDEGAVATQETRSKTSKWYNSPVLLADLLRPYAALYGLAVIEAVSPMPGQGVSSQCRFTGSMYMAQGVAAGLGLRMRAPTPSKWKRDMGLSSDKEQSRAAAIAQWPQHAKLFSLKKHHDRAEAALLALWAVRNQP